MDAACTEGALVRRLRAVDEVRVSTSPRGKCGSDVARRACKEPSRTAERACPFAMPMPMPMHTLTAERACPFAMHMPMPMHTRTAERACPFVVISRCARTRVGHRAAATSRPAPLPIVAARRGIIQ